MLLNDMNEFTLLTVLNGIKRHFLITVALFAFTLWLLPSLNILDNRYVMQKIIITGSTEMGDKDYKVDFLDFNQMHAIIGSSNMAELLSNTLGIDGVAEYVISATEVGNISLVLKSHDRDNLINTANLIMQRLQEFDEIAIQKKILSHVDVLISNNRKLLQLITVPDEYDMVSNADLELYAIKQKIYNKAYGNDEARVEGNIDIDKIIRIKRDEISTKSRMKKQKLEINNTISKLELIKRIGYIKVSYLYPSDLKDTSKYYPNAITFFGISLLMVFFYNLIMLNFLYIKYKKSV